MANFLEEWYKIPTATSNYTKFIKDETVKIRILESWAENNCITYYEYFADLGEWNKPIRQKDRFTETPGIENGRKQKEMWAFKVYNYSTETVELCHISQKTIKEVIMNYINDEDYGDPLWYDIKITRNWEGLETVYWVVSSPPKEFDTSLIEWKDKTIDWDWFLNCETEIFTDIVDHPFD